MNPPSFIAITTLVLALAASGDAQNAPSQPLVAASLSDCLIQAIISDPAGAPGPSAPMIDPIAPVIDTVKLLTYENRHSLATSVEEMDRNIETQLAEWTANGRHFPQKSKEQFTTSRHSAQEKLRAIGLAKPETWKLVQHEAMLALQNLRGALHALGNSAKNE